MAVLLTLLLTALSAAAQTSTPPLLTGEIFTISPLTVTANCNPAGTSTVSYTVSGTATGPYPGSYSENGTFTIGPERLPQYVNGYEAGPITSARVNFDINSSTGQVSGTKSLPASSVDAWAVCYAPASGGGSFVELCACSLSLSYTATITTSSGAFRDTGSTGLILDQVQGTVLTLPPSPTLITPINTFKESFISNGIVPLVPTRED